MKTVLVTGGGTGIGAAVCRALAKRGVNVAINHLGEMDLSDAEGVAQECCDLGVEALVVQGDVGVDADCFRLVETTVSRFGGLTYLVNNAGYSHGRPLSDLDGVEPDEFEKAFRVNAIGPFLLARYAAPHLRVGGGGAIVNVASMAGLTGMGSSYGYCASKAAQINLTRSLARSLAPDIRVNVVCPGLVDTPWPRRALGDRFDAVSEMAAANSPLGKILAPEEVATPIVFLLMDGTQLTGEVIRVDGGGHLGAG